MSISRIVIENFKSIKYCDVEIKNSNLFIGENGSGKSNVLDAIEYFYSNLTNSNVKTDVFDINNRFSNEIKITIFYDLSDLYKIASCNKAISSKHDGYFSKIIAMSKMYNKILKMQMKQQKGKGIDWSLKEFNDRLFVKNLFPLYKFDTRKLDILEWDELWSSISDLTKLSNEEERELKKEIKIQLEKSSNINKIKSVQDIFLDNNIKLKEFQSSEFANFIANIYFGGKEFYKDGHKLDLYSTGTNSVNYIKLILKTLSLLNKYKIKEPILLIDEPEINLHPSFIDDLVDSFAETSKNISLLITTHSSRLTKCMIKADSNLALYKLVLRKSYSELNRMNLFSINKKANYQVADDHANAYFSKVILFVEGETELELFSNPYLKILFPDLKKIEIYKAISNNVVKDIMLPSKVKSKVQYYILIDCDKVLSYSKSENKFICKEYLKESLENSKEYLLVNNKNNELRFKIYGRRLAFQKMIAENAFIVDNTFFSSEDYNFHSLIKMIKEYLLNYNVFTLKTTIEGSIINKRTIDLAINFISKKKNGTAVNSFKNYFKELNTTNQSNVLRLIFDGKSDFLLKLKDTKISNINQEIINAIKFTKQSGWVTEFLKFYFEATLGVKTVNELKKFIRDDCDKFEVIDDFKHYFYELYELINKTQELLYVS